MPEGDNIEVVNPNKQIRSRLADTTVLKPPRLVSGALRTVVPAGARARIRVTARRLNNRLNVRRAPRPPLPEELREQIAREFADEVQKLGALIGRPLGLDPSSPNLRAWGAPGLARGGNRPDD